MKAKPFIALVVLSTLELSFSVRSIADKAISSSSVSTIKKSTSSSSNKPAVEAMPSIANEAEYAEFVKKREGASQASSIKSVVLSGRSSSRSSASAK